MAARASRRAGVEVPYDVQYAIATDPAGFDAKVMEWDARKRAALDAETAAGAAVAAAKAEQDALARDRAEFNTRQTEAKANLAAERDEFNALAKAENARLVNWDGELADRERRLDAERTRLDDLAATTAANLRESETARASAEQALEIATAARQAATNLKAKYEALVERFQRFGVELQA
jgi:hypothetical protein